MTTEAPPRECRTCLYMATHENCTGCNPDWIKGQWAYQNYQEGNWMKRLIRQELKGERDIVIGGQGEAEVNALGDPKKTSKHLHYVAEQCGYMVGHLTSHDDGTQSLSISTSEGNWQLVWDDKGLARIAALDYDGQDTGKDFWNRDKFRDMCEKMAD